MKYLMLTILLLFLPSAISAQHAHMDSSEIRETGQDAFAALAEIVIKLRENPNTDWSTVSVSALRAHLQDMNRVALQAEVRTEKQDLETSFHVEGEGSVIGSVQRMVLAHAPMLETDSGWTVKAETKPEGAILTVGAKSLEEQRKINALGFFGLMTIGAHHQMHHLMIATGNDPH
ncbi:hypothetical protein [Cohaesibacter intestini]|uniref:hypothetical protein n=1 Tax=Cohaesibacter intestini TaxID=2211145 RepID=UPI0013001C55|nr:hypothetical protein [Cohaesibacter intestini]